MVVIFFGGPSRGEKDQRHHGVASGVNVKQDRAPATFVETTRRSASLKWREQ
jgi:hypothetical protein